MNATLEIARGSLEAAKDGIDHPGSMSEAEIHDLLDTARRLIDRTTEATRLEALEAHGKAAMAELDQLEQIRRLLSYGLAHGRTNADGKRLHDLLEARPKISKTSTINATTRAFEWLAANRREISQLLKTINPTTT